MSREAKIEVRAFVQLGVSKYSPPLPQFYLDMSAPFGPTPGAKRVPVEGLLVDLSELTVPGLVILTNVGTVTIHYGPYDPDAARWLPLFQVAPGQSFPAHFSSMFGQEYEGTGTGTASLPNTKLFLLPEGGEGDVIIDAFEA